MKEFCVGNLVICQNELTLDTKICDPLSAAIFVDPGDQALIIARVIKNNSTQLLLLVNSECGWYELLGKRSYDDWEIV